MKSAIGHRGRHAGISTTPFLAADVGGTPARVALMFRRPGTVQHGLSIAFVWLAATGMAIAASATSTWSLLPLPADVRPAPSGVVEIADGALVAVRGADREQVQPTVDRFVQLVANTRGLQLHTATTADAHPAITFDHCSPDWRWCLRSGGTGKTNSTQEFPRRR